MPDKMTPWQRSECMSRIRSKDTRSEMIVRRVLHEAVMREIATSSRRNYSQ